MQKIQIAVDGFSACGKSTLSKALAEKLKYLYIDSGAMYRAVTLYALKKSIIKNNCFDKKSLIANLSKINIDFKLNPNNQPYTYLNGENVENIIRNIEVSSYVSEVSTIPEVRHKMVEIQQQLGKNKGIVMDGRDIGTVVFPKAELKLFITASIDIRTKRRYDELILKGEKVDFENIKMNLINRDKIDSTRSESPLQQTADAIVIDNSNLTQQQQLDLAFNYAIKIIR